MYVPVFKGEKIDCPQFSKKQSRNYSSRSLFLRQDLCKSKSQNAETGYPDVCILTFCLLCNGLFVLLADGLAQVFDQIFRIFHTYA